MRSIYIYDYICIDVFHHPTSSWLATSLPCNEMGACGRNKAIVDNDMCKSTCLFDACILHMQHSSSHTTWMVSHVQPSILWYKKPIRGGYTQPINQAGRSHVCNPCIINSLKVVISTPSRWWYQLPKGGDINSLKVVPDSPKPNPDSQKNLTNQS